MGRLAHKIKGTGSTLGFDVLAAVTLVFEDVIRALQSGAVVARPEAVGSLTGLLAFIESALAASVAEQSTDTAPGELITLAEAIRDGLLATQHLEWDDPAETHPSEAAALASQIISAPTGAETDSSSSRQRVGDVESFLRVEVHRLDELMTHVNALALNRASFMQMRDDILRLQGELDQALARLDTVSHQVTDLNPQQGWLSTLNAIHTSGPLQQLNHHSSVVGDGLVSERFSEFDQALRQLTEVVADTTSASKYLHSALTRLDQIGDEQATITHDIQRDVMQIRLVHLEDLMPRIQLEARRLAASLGKAISFTTRGQMTEIDRNISEALAEPLIQLVRNAVVHGIEPGEERVEHGKSMTGNIWIHAYYVGSEVVIEVGDDGRGVNPHRLAASAVALGLVDAEAARGMAFSEALDMMFVPGITTFREAQIVAGRGIGLDEVRTAIQRLKGTIQVRSEPGEGSVFRIRVPISLSIVRALGIQVAGQPFAVPFSSVLQMISISQEDLSPLPPLAAAGVGGMAARTSFGLRLRVDGGVMAKGQREEDNNMPHHQGAVRGIASAPEVSYEQLPALQLADLLGFESSTPATQLALILEVGRRRVALLVDQVSDDQEVVVQTLPSHLRRRSIRGTTVTPDGLVQLLLDLPELLQSVQSGDRLLPAPRRKPLPPAEVSKAPRVLVVDDSMSIRGALELTLTRAGFDVQLARDGIEAFEMMRVAVPRVVVLDIEMPRLDGFELLSVMRETPQFAEIRVIMLTSRAADKHREQALKLGASAYLIKPCPQETLIETVRAQIVDQTSRGR
jgi:chemosensory pili system protein ChpA (sensor histidine kinase/response regulator)